MEFSTRKLRKWVLVSAGFTLLISGALESLAAEKSSSFERKQETWSQLNYYSPTEGFHSKGSYGLHLGIGAVAPTPLNEGEKSEERNELEQPKARLFISKGTPWPVDFGASFSILEGKKAMQGGLHMQWTVYEGFQMPSIAFRASRSMLSNYHELKELTTDSIELGASYGIIRYVILSLGVSQQWEKGKTQAEDEFLMLADTDLPEWSDRRTVYSWGLNISPFTPFVQIGLEQSYWNKRTQVSLAKISFLL
jgi:hypothetical protein